MTSSRIRSFLSAAILSLAVSAAGQVPSSQPTAAAGSAAPIQVPPLDVISVKPNQIGDLAGSSWGPTPDGVMGKNITPHMMLVNAYKLNENQLIKEPNWAKTQRFDFMGKVTNADPAVVAKLTPDQKRIYFEQVLKERFGLVAHHETRKLPEYALIPAKSGVKLEDGKPDPNATPDMKDFSGFMTGSNGAVVTIRLGDTRIDPLLVILSNETGRTVVDRTGLTGKYSFTLKFKSAMEKGAADDAADSTPDLFTAIQEQLGLKLEPTKGPANVLVIEHIERPVAN